MNKYMVLTGNRENPIEIEAAELEVSGAGDLVFRDRATKVVYVIAPGAWLEAKRVG